MARMKPSPVFEMEDLDEEASVSMTWSIDANGTMRHKMTDMKISPDTGIEVAGREYRISPEDIDVDASRHLGSGACGAVLLGVLKSTGQQVAIKTVKVEDKPKREQLLNEIRGLVSAEGCPNLVQWYAGFVHKRTNSVNVILEFMDRGSLADLKKKLALAAGAVCGVPEPHLACITRQVMAGLAHLHNLRMLHRDIKPENILHNNAGEVKLTDFGIAKDLDHTVAMAGTFVGTVTYMSPERCLGEDYDLASDIWSVGMVVFELATGMYPFKESDRDTFPKLFAKLCEEPEPRLDAGLYNPQLADFAALCLTRDVAMRPDTFRLCTHPYVTEGVESPAELAAFFATLPA